MMRHYRSKPQEIRAAQFDGTEECATRIMRFLTDLSHENEKLYENLHGNKGIGWFNLPDEEPRFELIIGKDSSGEFVTEEIEKDSYVVLFEGNLSIFGKEEFEEKFEFVPWEELRNGDMWPETNPKQILAIGTARAIDLYRRENGLKPMDIKHVRSISDAMGYADVTHIIAVGDWRQFNEFSTLANELMRRGFQIRDVQL